jgi:hypothetical protein
MPEAGWLRSDDPLAMLASLREDLSQRKGKLLAVACCRLIWDLMDDERSRQAVEVAERFADGLADLEELRSAAEAASVPWLLAGREMTEQGRAPEEDPRSAALAAAYYTAEVTSIPGRNAKYMLWCVCECRPEAKRTAPALIRCLFGNPFRPMPPLPASLLTWNGGVIPQLAQAAYDERLLPQGTLDEGRLAVLADALEEAGCTDTEILQHCRGPGPHVRGCWILDLLLGKDPQAARVPQAEVPGVVRFRPSRTEGLPDVREVVVRSDRLEVNTAGRWVTFPFDRIGRRQESRVTSFIKRLVGRQPWRGMVADRDWFHLPRDRFFLWYTDPPLRTCMPEHEPADHAASYFARIQAVIGSGGYGTFDLG